MTAPVEPTPGRSGRSTGKVVAAAVGALAIVGAGVFAITRISGDGAASGGADSPEAAAELLLDAIDAEDALGAIDVLLPGERETLREPMQRVVSRLADWDVLSDDDLSGVSGVDLTVTDRDVEVAATNVDDIVNLTVSATVAATVDGSQLPIGDWMREQIGEEEVAELDEELEPEAASFPVTAVEQDGRWYLSLFYTAAEQARASTDLDVPEEGIAPVGGDSPEAAVDAFVQAAADLDLTALVATLDPDEFEALQRYAPLFLDDGQRELDDGIREADVAVTVSDTEYDVSGSGAQRSVAITALSLEITAEGETLSGRLADGCFVGTVPGEPDEIDSCELQQQLEDELDLDDVVEDPQAVEDAIADIQAAFDDYENPGLVVREVDGSWYVSPMATVSGQVLAVMEALSREEIEDLGSQIDELVELFEDQVVGSTGIDVPTFDDFELPSDDEVVTASTAVPGTVAPDDTHVTDDTDATEGTVTDDTTVTASTYVDEACYDLDAADAQSCFEGLVDDGRIDAEQVPWYFRFPECGAAEAVWDGDYYTLPDDEFVAQVEAWQPCVQALITSGEAAESDFDEVGRPQCLDGANPYLESVSNEDFDTFLDCVYG